MFIQLCQGKSDGFGICCRLSDLSPEDGERFLFALEGKSEEAETGRDPGNETRSERAEFPGLTAREVYVINAYTQTPQGWVKAASCKAVPSALRFQRLPEQIRTRGDSLPPAGIVLNGSGGWRWNS